MLEKTIDFDQQYAEELAKVGDMNLNRLEKVILARHAANPSLIVSVFHVTKTHRRNMAYVSLCEKGLLVRKREDPSDMYPWMVYEVADKYLNTVFSIDRNLEELQSIYPPNKHVALDRLTGPVSNVSKAAE